MKKDKRQKMVPKKKKEKEFYWDYEDHLPEDEKSVRSSPLTGSYHIKTTRRAGLGSMEE